MTHSIFGWSYPPGCSGPPEGDDPTPLQEAVWELCEKRGLAAPAIERVQAVLIEEEAAILEAEYAAQAEAEYAEGRLNEEQGRTCWAQQGDRE
jgi:hypothetical protein